MNLVEYNRRNCHLQPEAKRSKHFILEHFQIVLIMKGTVNEFGEISYMDRDRGNILSGETI